MKREEIQQKNFLYMHILKTYIFLIYNKIRKIVIIEMIFPVEKILQRKKKKLGGGARMHQKICKGLLRFLLLAHDRHKKYSIWKKKKVREGRWRKQYKDNISSSYVWDYPPDTRERRIKTLFILQVHPGV